MNGLGNILLFIFLPPVWGIRMLGDAKQSPVVRLFAGLVLIGSGLLVSVACFMLLVPFQGS